MNLRYTLPDDRSFRIRVTERERWHTGQREREIPSRRYCLFGLLSIIFVLLFCIVIVLTIKFSMHQSSGGTLNPDTTVKIVVSTSVPPTTTTTMSPKISSTTKSSQKAVDLSENRSKKPCCP